MFTNKLFHSSIVRFGLLVVMLCFSVFIGVQFTGQAKAALSQSPIAAPVAVNPAAVGVDTLRFECQVTHVHEFIHVEQSVLITCATAAEGKYWFFSQPASDPSRAARVMAMALTAITSGKPLSIDYEPANTNVIGCSPENCRNIFSIGIHN